MYASGDYTPSSSVFAAGVPGGVPAYSEEAMMSSYGMSDAHVGTMSPGPAVYSTAGAYVSAAELSATSHVDAMQSVAHPSAMPDDGRYGAADDGYSLAGLMFQTPSGQKIELVDGVVNISRDCKLVHS